MAARVVVPAVQGVQRRADAFGGPNSRDARGWHEEPLHRLRYLRNAEQAPVVPVVRELALWEREQRLHAASVHERDAKLSVREERTQRCERLWQLGVTGQNHARIRPARAARHGRYRRQPLLRSLLGPSPGPVGTVAPRDGTVYEREANLQGTRRQRRAEALDEFTQRRDGSKPRLREPVRENPRVARTPRAQLCDQRGGLVLVAVQHLPRRRRRRFDFVSIRRRRNRLRLRAQLCALHRLQLAQLLPQRRHDPRHHAPSHHGAGHVLSLERHREASRGVRLDSERLDFSAGSRRERERVRRCALRGLRGGHGGVRGALRVVRGGEDGSHGGFVVSLVVGAERPEPKFVDDRILGEWVLEAGDGEYGSHEPQARGVQRRAFRAVQQVVVPELLQQVVLVLHEREDAADGVARAMRARVVAAEVLVPLLLILQYLRQRVDPRRGGGLPGQ